jgi:hypothetical protein
VGVVQAVECQYTSGIGKYYAKKKDEAGQEDRKFASGIEW